jgi:hypothetical protein
VLLPSGSDTVRRPCRAGPSLTELTTTPGKIFSEESEIYLNKFKLNAILATSFGFVNNFHHEICEFLQNGIGIMSYDAILIENIVS